MQTLGVVIFRGGRTVCRLGVWSTRNEWSDSARIYHVVSGRGWIEINGKRDLLKVGRIHLIPPHSTITYEALTDVFIEWLHFRFESEWFNVRLGTLSHLYFFSKKVTDRWSPTCRLIERYFEKSSTDDVFRMHAMIMELSAIAFAGLSQESPQERRAHERLLPALSFMDENATRHPSLSDIAKKVDLSAEHFHRMFREVFNVTPFQYVHAKCMAQALQLLSQGKCSVKETAEQCGYEDPFYFSRVFSEYFNASPGKIRQGKIIIVPKA